MTDTSEFQHGMAEVAPDVQLHYVQTGQGPEIMVLVHGYPETWWEWRHVMPIFASAGYRVIAVDYRGAGNSSKPASGYDKRTMAQWSARLEMCQWIRETLDEESVWDVGRSTSLSR
jgi:pimeloyl-ACP methyl ester carboxylesterase